MPRPGDFDIRLSRAQAEALLRSPEVKDMLQRKAEAIARACGDGFEALRSTEYTDRARSAVLTVTNRARHSNRRNNTIIRNMGEGRG